MRGKKRKNTIQSLLLTVTSIVSGFALIIVGYWVLDRVVEHRRHVLLSQKGSVSTVGYEELDKTTEIQLPEKLTEKELQDILIRNTYGQDMIPHEPYGLQMNMQEAIETGEQWIREFCGLYSFPNEEGVIHSGEISAQLCTNKNPEDVYTEMLSSEESSDKIGSSNIGSEEIKDNQEFENLQPGNQLSESMYGYWKLTFAGNGITIHLMVHAVTGQILKMEIDSFLTDASLTGSFSMRDMLERYVDSFGLEGSVTWDGEDSKLYAICNDSICFEGIAETYYAEDIGYTGTEWQAMFYMCLAVGR